ncbi:MAG: hypothetical protein ACYDC1_16350, partial [Limisphaerales bacterium]
IGGAEAEQTLVAARDRASAQVRPAVLDGLLLCAENNLAAGDGPAAVALVRDLTLPAYPAAVRGAAWRCLVLADAAHRAPSVAQALVGQDAVLRSVAVRMVRELDDPEVTGACLARWDSLDEAAQLAVLDASLKLDAAARAAVRQSIDSPVLAVRVAAWRALGDHGEASLVPALVRAAATGEAGERAAARDSLARVRGEGIREALIKHLQTAPAPERAEVLRVLGNRGDATAGPVMLRFATAEPAAVRLAALESLRTLALAETLLPLLEMAGRSGPETDIEPVLQALFAVCQASRDKDQTARVIVEAMPTFSAAGRRQVLPLLPELATPAALDAALSATRESDVELVKEAVRTLGRWPSAAPAPRLLELARTSSDASLHALALRGFITVVAQEPQPAARLAGLKSAMSVAKRPEERRQVLGQLGQIPTSEALREVLPALEEAALANEAGLAAVSIAEKIKPADPALAADAATRVLTHCQGPDLVKRAWALRGQPPGSGPFIQDWLVAGPYRHAEVNDVSRMFDLALGPEASGETVVWKPVPRADLVPLATLFPEQSACVAYLKTTITAPEDTKAMLLLGSDDGIKAWLNGAVVHANNVDRGAVADSDMVPVQLKAGANQLLLKITQGGGGWASCARLVSPDGQPLPGLKYQATP